MKFIYGLLFLLSLVDSFSTKTYIVEPKQYVNPTNNCITFSVSPGTGCAWMCNYCASQLGTNNYYFTTNVCTYQTGGCTGNPQSGVSYSCCSN
jgi:hypothetical protein